MARRRRRRIAEGVYRDRWGLAAAVKVHGQQREKRFPPETSLKTIRTWRNETRVALGALAVPDPDAGSLEADILAYQTQIAAMPTAAQRLEHLALWQSALGPHTPRTQITPDAIRAVLQTWRLTLSAATCNKRRTALMHLYSLLDGKGARNPVRDVQKFRVADPLPRGRDPHVLDAQLLLASRCRSRAACRVLLWTGARPDELQRAQPDDLDLKAGTVILRTAKGGRTRLVPLTRQAVAAWKEFDRDDVWGHVPQSAPLGRWLKAHMQMNLRVYDLRHSYGTALAKCGTRLDVIAALMGHSTLELTRRYTLAAIVPDAAAATIRLAVSAGSAKRGNKTGRKSA